MHGKEAGRTLECTSESVRAICEPDGKTDLAALMKLPTLFAMEAKYDNSHRPARVGTLLPADRVGRNIQIEFVCDPDIAPISNEVLTTLANDLQIDVRASINEFSRNHRSTKDVDLFKVLLKRGVGVWPSPKMFKMNEAPQDPNLVAVMMPFDTGFAITS
jgi:hypothetical protein